MLEPLLPLLNTKRIILASNSPRRKELLERIGLKFEIVPSTFEENLRKESFSSPLEYVKETAKHKVQEVANRLYGEGSPPDLIIGADTVVIKDNEIFEKPRSREHAVEILTRFSGNSHTVNTAVVLVTPCNAGNDPPSIPAESRYKLTEFQEETEVLMGDLTREIIEAYVDTGEPMDKAGGYGIQALGSTLIKGVKGDYFNVIGFPLHPFSKIILRLYSGTSRRKNISDE